MSDIRTRNLRRRLVSGAAFVALSAGAALAQASAGGDVETVTVTGSRISTPGFQSPTPLTVLDPKSLQMLVENGVEAVEYDIPELSPNETTVGQAGGGALSTLNLRGLGATRTLVLLNGERVMPTNGLNGTIDVNTFPAVLISNISVVTGGAGASYGSDAVAGVVNITLSSDFEGFKASVQAGQSQYSDYKNYDTSAVYGVGFAGGKGHFEIAGELYHNNGVCCQGSRPWDAGQWWGLLANPLSKAGNGIAKNYFASNTNLSVEADNGLITSGPLKGTTFTAAGVPTTFTYGTSVGSVFQVGGGPGTNFAPYGNIFPEEARVNGYSRATFDVSEDLHVFAEVLLGRQQSYYPVITNFDSADITIGINNAFLPSSLKAAMVANNITTFVMGRPNYDLGPCKIWNGVQECGMAVTNYIDNTYHVAAGANGEIDGWKWTFFTQYNNNTNLDSIQNDKILSNWANAVDSVVSPTTGQPVCRSTLTAPTNGCVPVNLFGANTISPAATNYVTETFRLPETETELDVSLNVQGALFDDWAGTVSLASGIEWRRESENGVNDPNAVLLNLFTQGLAIQGHYTVAEAYLETVVPLAKDQPWLKNLEVNAAVREAQYSTSGNANTWKLGVNYTPVDDQFRIRGTVSHDLRAPNLAELFQPQGFGINTVTNTFTNVQTTIRTFTGGNPSLVPEQANSITAGFIYQPDFLPGFEGSVDYFQTTIHGAINTLTNQQVVNFCFQGLAAYCANITSTTGNPATGTITSVLAVKFNFQQLYTDGIDFENSYHFEGSDLFSELPGAFTIRMLGNYVEHLQTVASGSFTEFAGQVGSNSGVPHWRMNLTTRWDVDPFTIQANVRYTQGGTLNATYVQGVDISSGDDHIPSRTYLDITGSYDAWDGIQLFGKVGNVFNRNPPLTPTSILKPLAASSPFYDDIGRVYSMGVRVKL